MKTLKTKGTHEQFIAGKNGEVQYVIIPVDEYKILSNLLEDYGLGLAMQMAMKDTMYAKEEALKFLEDA